MPTMFKQPLNLPQDLLLIQELIADTTLEQRQNPEKDETDSDSSSDSDSDSDISSSAESSSDSDNEKELVEELLAPEAQKDESNSDSMPTKVDDVIAASSSSESESEESSEELESEDESDHKRMLSVLDKFAAVSDSEDEGNGAGLSATGSALHSKNEIQEPDIVVPDITEVGENELLEKIGTVMSIIDNAVVVKGIPSQVANRGAERALDSESLLVFEDRKVLGFICETFGPTTMPMYQVKFPSSSAIDKTIITVGRDVFHVPSRSKFVFPSQLQKLKGSDASNVHDEEIGADEIEFSDDEAEAAYKRQLKRKRDGRRDSVSSFRSSSSNPSHLRDQEMNGDTFSTSAFDEYSPYDVGMSAGPSSRAAPLPYDDPYQDTVPSQDFEAPSPSSQRPRGPPMDYGRSRDGRERGRGRSRGRDHGDRGRGRGRGRGGRGGPPSSHFRSQSHGGEQNFQSMTPSAPETSWSGENYGYTHFAGPYQEYNPNTAWQVPHNFYQPQQAQQQSPQPHINPRFFGFNAGFASGQTQLGSPSQAYGSESLYGGQYDGNWSGSWAQSGPQPQGNAGASGGENTRDGYVPP